MATASCIWCDTRPANSLEHILPESLGCPQGFVLSTGVCKTCNNKFSKLDRALLTPFELITVIKQIPRKKGRLPTVDGFSSFSSGYDKNGPTVFMNRESYPVQTPNGRCLKGTTKVDPIKNTKWEHLEDGQIKTSFQQELRFDRRAVRCLFKIALESIALFEGLEATRVEKYDGIRNFVRNGNGSFRAIMMSDQNDKYQSYFTSRFTQKGKPDCVPMTILGIGFICDFDPEFEGGRTLVAAAKNENIGAQVLPNWPKAIWKRNNEEF